MEYPEDILKEAKMGKPIYIQPNHPNTFSIIYQDVFHLKSLYIAMFMFLEEHGWSSRNGEWEDPTGDDKWETMYYDNRSKGNRKIWIWWRMQKPTGNSYYQLFLDVNLMFLGWKDVEVVHEGMKYKAQIGELTIFVKPWYETDFKDKWANHPILRHVHPFFSKRVFHKDIINLDYQLLKETNEFLAVIKNFLEQKKFIPDEELLFEPRRKFG